MTAPGDALDLDAMPAEIGALCKVVQGVLIHRDIAPWLYDLALSEQARDDAHIRPIAAMLARIHASDPRPLGAARDPAKRLTGVCRHFSLMLTAMLRHRKIPARTRCGFAGYLTPGRFEDHWVCEYWNADQVRWILVDAQLDAVQRKAFGIRFDPLDVPRDRFVVAGDAWRAWRAGGADPNLYGLSHVPGLLGSWFIAGNVARDLASLNRMEMLPWDVWGLMPANDAGLDEKKRALLDRIAALTAAGDDALPEVREIYESDDRLRVPPVVFNALRNAPEKIAN